MQEQLGSTIEGRDGGICSSLRALTLVAARIGVDVSLDQCRRRFARFLVAREPDTRTLIALARELGLEAQALRTTFQELPRLARALPAILRAKNGAALILEDARSDPAKGTVAVVRDPSAAGDVVLAIDELHLAEVWDGEAILIKRLHLAVGEQQPFGMAWLISQVLRERKLFREIGVAALVEMCFCASRHLFIFMIVLDRVLDQPLLFHAQRVGGRDFDHARVRDHVDTGLRRKLTQAA